LFSSSAASRPRDIPPKSMRSLWAAWPPQRLPPFKIRLPCPISP
jgi:hypothetical protein